MVNDKSAIYIKIFIYTFFAFLTLSILLPLIIIFASSFKQEIEIFGFNVKILPKDPTLQNYKELTEFPRYLYNSLKVTTIIVFVQFITSSTSAYAFSKLKWKAKNFVFIIYLATMMLPAQTYIIPQFLIVQRLGLYNSHAALVAVGAFTAFGTFMMKQFFETIPDSLIEVARIDGASDWKIFFQIMLPLSKPASVSLILFSFRFFWNDFFSPFIYIQTPSKRTIPLALTTFISQYDVRYGPQMAAAVVAIVPILIIFLSIQKYFVNSSIASGLKG